MPTWSAPRLRDELSQKTRSPGRRSPLPTAFPLEPCWYEMRGRFTPNCFMTYWVKPEQSNPEGDVPPHTYGVPMNCFAKSTSDLFPRPPPADGELPVTERDVPPPDSLVLNDVWPSIWPQMSPNVSEPTAASGVDALNAPSPNAPVVIATPWEAAFSWAVMPWEPSPAFLTPVREPFSCRSGLIFATLTHLLHRGLERLEECAHVRRGRLVGAVVRPLHGLLEQQLLSTLSRRTLLDRRARVRLASDRRGRRRLVAVHILGCRLGRRLWGDVRRPGLDRRVLALVGVQGADELSQFSTRRPATQGPGQHVLDQGSRLLRVGDVRLGGRLRDRASGRVGRLRDRPGLLEGSRQGSRPVSVRPVTPPGASHQRDHLPRGLLRAVRVLVGRVRDSVLPDLQQVIQGLSLEAVLLGLLAQPLEIEVVLVEHGHGLFDRPDVVLFLDLPEPGPARDEGLVPAHDRSHALARGATEVHVGGLAARPRRGRRRSGGPRGSAEDAREDPRDGRLHVASRGPTTVRRIGAVRRWHRHSESPHFRKHVLQVVSVHAEFVVDLLELHVLLHEAVDERLPLVPKFRDLKLLRLSRGEPRLLHQALHRDPTLDVPLHRCQVGRLLHQIRMRLNGLVRTRKGLHDLVLVVGLRRVLGVPLAVVLG